MRPASAAAMCLLAAAIAGCGGQPRSEKEGGPDPRAATGVESAPAAEPVDAERAALEKPDPKGTYGAGIHLPRSTALAELLANPEAYAGRIVQVQGTVASVCQLRGCWMELSPGSGGTLRVQVPDGEIVIPKSAQGHTAVAEGVVEKIELSEEQHRAWKAHQAEEAGTAYDPALTTGPLTLWRIQGLGVRID